jgi:hypothetical protein
MTLRQAFLALLALWALAAPAQAQDVTNPTPPNSINGAYNASAPTCTDGHGCWLQTDANGNLKVVPSTSSESGAATTRASSTAAASNLVLKGSAGNLYDLTVTIGATSGYLMLFDATALPSNGAVTPAYCLRVNSDGTAGGASLSWPAPMRFGTGITAGFSTTGCFTLTASATGNFFGGYK